MSDLYEALDTAAALVGWFFFGLIIGLLVVAVVL